ncbi:MAG: hypothetical protein QXI33_03105 [Candidatus Pacearchaeota archaeon]
MFRETCPKCEKKFNKKYSYCPYCGFDRKAKKEAEDYGFLGKKDLNESDMNLPFGFKILLKPLIKELNKQMAELDKEMRREENELKKSKNTMKFTNFSVHIGIPGQKPVKMAGSIPLINLNNSKKSGNISLVLPKLDKDSLLKAKDFPREEPETIVRRLSDKIVYEISLPGVSSIDDINITKLEDSIEIKAISKKTVYLKTIDISLPLINYYFSDEKLVLELDLR